MLHRPERQLCLRCLRSRAVCYCADIRAVRAPFEAVILQHPKERKNTIGTARLTALCLTNAKLIDGTEFENDPAVNAILDDPSRLCTVLFPGPGSCDVSVLGWESEPFRALASDPSLRPVVFVIDGTWTQAKSMLRKSPRLASLPRISFSPGAPSTYRVRKQPHHACLSTIEAVHRLIRILEPRAPVDHLLRHFDTLVEQQLSRAAERALREISG